MEPQLSKPTIVFMVVVALVFDLFQLLLDLLHILVGPGTIIAAITTGLLSFVAWLTFYIWFKTKGMSFTSPKRILTMGGGFLIELIPVLNVLPAWTLAVIILIGTNKAEALIEKTTGVHVDLNNPTKDVKIKQ